MFFAFWSEKCENWVRERPAWGLGSLVYISESNGSQPQIRAFEDAAVRSMALSVAAPAPTSVSGGELEISMFVQAVFAIQ